MQQKALLCKKGHYAEEREGGECLDFCCFEGVAQARVIHLDHAWTWLSGFTHSSTIPSLCLVSRLAAWPTAQDAAHANRAQRTAERDALGANRRVATGCLAHFGDVHRRTNHLMAKPMMAETRRKVTFNDN